MTAPSLAEARVAALTEALAAVTHVYVPFRPDAGGVDPFDSCDRDDPDEPGRVCARVRTDPVHRTPDIVVNTTRTAAAEGET